MLAEDRFGTGTHKRLLAISDEIGKINSHIVRNLQNLDESPDLIEDLIRRCDSLLVELKELRAERDIRSHGFLPSKEPASGSGMQA